LQRRREQQRAASNPVPQLVGVTNDTEDERSDAGVSDAGSEEANSSRSGLLALPYAVAVMCRNIISKPFDEVTKFVRSVGDWLWSWPLTLVEQVRTRQIGRGNKILLIVACILFGAWLLLSQRPRTSTPIADNATKKPPITANADAPVVRHPDLPSPIAT